MNLGSEPRQPPPSRDDLLDDALDEAEAASDIRRRIDHCRPELDAKTVAAAAEHQIVARILYLELLALDEEKPVSPRLLKQLARIHDVTRWLHDRLEHAERRP